MKTLIFNGSPRKNGDTVSLINNLKNSINGEYKIVNTYYCNISPCIDCRYCKNNKGCIINDDMQEIYKYIEESDNILIASPIYFSELTGPLLSVLSRVQMYFSSEFFRREKIIKKEKKGAVVLVGGGTGDIKKPYETAKIILKQMNVNKIFPLVYNHETDKYRAIENQETINGINKIANFFNGK